MTDEFQLAPEIVHLNHAGIAPWPRRAHEAAVAFSEENRRGDTRRYPLWMQAEDRLRARLARLIGAASPDDIALLKSTSEGLSFVAAGLDWTRGDNVVCPRQEFPSNRVVWQSLAARFGVEVRLVDIGGAKDPEGAILDAIDGNTRLVAVSAVQYASGLRHDLERIGDHCRARGVLFCIDAIQQIGALPFDVEACRADFVAADGHKWMCGPEGVALFWCRPELRERLALTEYGWHTVRDRSNYTRIDWEIDGTACRFECGSPNLLGIHALDASLSLIEETGIECIAAELLGKTARLMERLDAHGMAILTPRDDARRAGIVTFTPTGMDAEDVYRRLMGKGIICAPRGGGLRFSPHWYTDDEAIGRAVEMLVACLE